MMFSGRVGIYRGEYTLTNPHYALFSRNASGSDMAEAATAPVPVYKAPVKLPTDRIAGYIEQLLEKIPLRKLEDPVPYAIRRVRKIHSLEWTYRALHTPDTEDTWRAAQAGIVTGILLALDTAFIARGLMIASQAQSLFSRLLAASMTMIVFTYAFVNIGMVIGILPVVGVPLPFMSYGGTALVTLGVGCGMLMCIAHENAMQRHRAGRQFIFG